MLLSTDVSLPNDVQPEFPDCCVVCSCKSDSYAELYVHSRSSFLVLLLPVLMFSGWSRIKVPVCKRCRHRFFLQRWGRSLVAWATIAVVIWGVSLLIPHWEATDKAMVILGAGMMVALQYVLLEGLLPRKFDLSASSTKTTYEFKSSSAAFEFYLVNRNNHPDADIRIISGD